MTNSIGRILIASGLVLIGGVIVACNLLNPMANNIAKHSQAELAKARVVQLQHYDQTGYSGGTGWMIVLQGRTYIVTNKHVCADENTVLIRPEGEFYFYRGIVTRVSKVTDLCLILAERGLPTTLGGYDLADKAPIKGDTLQVYGYGYLGPLLGVESKYLGLLRIPPEWGPQLAGIVVGVLSNEIYHGHSGSPVLNTDGNVVGVAFAIMPTGPKSVQALFITLDQLRHFLTNTETSK